MVKLVTSKQNYYQSHPNNNIVLMFYFIKNDLNYLDSNVVHYWHHNKVKHEIKYSNFYDDSECMYYYPMNKIMEEMDYQDDDLPITPELQLFHDEFTKVTRWFNTFMIGKYIRIIISTPRHQDHPIVLII